MPVVENIVMVRIIKFVTKVHQTFVFGIFDMVSPTVLYMGINFSDKINICCEMPRHTYSVVLKSELIKLTGLF